MRGTQLIGTVGILVVASCEGVRSPADTASADGGITYMGGAAEDSGTANTQGAASEGTDGGGAGGSTAADGGDDLPAGPLIKWDVGFGGTGEGLGNTCQTGINEDADGDGFSVAAGDCNDCDANVNPGAIEVVVTRPDDMGLIPDPADEDCDGGIDNLPPPCDGAFAIDDTNALNGAGAMGLCKQAQDATDWGVVSAQYVRADGTPTALAAQQTGLLFDFGPNVAPREGSQALVLSTGRSRIPGQPDACTSQTCNGSGAGTAPAGFPQDVPACPGLNNINDDVALEVTLRAPTNATGYSYNFNFYSFEYPEWVCTAYNDQYIALVSPPPMGAINGNISFDSGSNPVSVNIAFFDVCAGCPLGTAELAGTGFDTLNDAGATSWLVTTAPVTGGEEITIRFAIWDTGDSAFDSTVLLDNFQWIADGGTVSLGTVPEG